MNSYSTVQVLIHVAALVMYLGAGGWSLYRLWKQNEENHLGVMGVALGGLLFNLVLVFWMLVDEGTSHIPRQFETVLGLTAGIALMSILLKNYARTPFTIPVGMFLSSLLMVFAGVLLARSSPGRSTLSFNAWMVLHVAMILLSYVVFTMGFISGLLFLLQDRMVRSKQVGGLMESLPSLERSEAISTTAIIVGFPLLSIGILIGILGGEYLFEHQLSMPWYQDPKVMFSMLTWGVYALLLWLRKILLVKGRKFAYMSVIGFCLILFTLFVGEFLWEGFHQNL